MTYQVALLNFAGPLDLLLQLIEQAKLEATQVSLASVTNQYLRHLRQLPEIDPDELNWFILLAAKLLLIKSQALLPQAAPEAVAEDAHELEDQLEHYRHYRRCALWLAGRVQQGLTSYMRPASSQAETQSAPALPPSLNLTRLAQAAHRAESRPATTTDSPSVLNIQEVSIDIMVQRLMKRLLQTSPQAWNDLAQVAKSREELVVLFVAMLELARHGQLKLSQPAQFDTIKVHYEAR